GPAARGAPTGWRHVVGSESQTTSAAGFWTATALPRTTLPRPVSCPLRSSAPHSHHDIASRPPPAMLTRCRPAAPDCTPPRSLRPSARPPQRCLPDRGRACDAGPLHPTARLHARSAPRPAVYHGVALRGWRGLRCSLAVGSLWSGRIGCRTVRTDRPVAVV